MHEYDIARDLVFYRFIAKKVVSSRLWERWADGKCKGYAEFAEQWFTVGTSQLIRFGTIHSIAQLGRCLQLRKRATNEDAKGR